MGMVEKYLEIEKAHEELCEQLYNKICFIHENVGKDYRTQDCWFDSRCDIIDVKEKEGFVEKDSNIVYENEQYDYVNTTEENGIRTHIYKKHVTEEVPSNSTTTPTDNNTTTENKAIVEHTAPTGDNMNNVLKLFALSVLGLGFVLLKRKGLRDE